MTLAELALWAFASYGLTFGVKDSKLTLRPRDFLKKVDFFEKLLSCSFCTGFWATLVISILWEVWGGSIIPTPALAAGLLIRALAGAASTYTIDLVVQLLEQALDNAEHPDEDDEEVEYSGPADEDG